MNSGVKRKLFERDEVPPVSVQGYVHEVSEKIRSTKSNAVYFNAVVQEKDAYNDIVVFSPDKREAFLMAQETKSPVRLRDVQIANDKYRPNKKRVLFGSKSRFENLQNKQLDFQNVEKMAVAIEEKTLSDIQTTLADYEKVSIKAKIIKLSDFEKHRFPDGRTVNRQNFWIADHTAGMELAAWDDSGKLFAEGTSYSIAGVTVNSFRNTKHLAIGRDATIETISDLAGIEFDVTETRTEIVGRIIHIQCTIHHLCTKCRNIIPEEDLNLEAKSLKCNNCGFRMLTSRVSKEIKASVNFEEASGQVHNHYLNKAVVEMLVDAEAINRAADQSTFIEESLLEFDEICLITNHGRIVSACVSTPI